MIRFETPAGRQAQVDFARFRFAWGVRYALLVVLGYSRLGGAGSIRARTTCRQNWNQRERHGISRPIAFYTGG